MSVYSLKVMVVCQRPAPNTMNWCTFEFEAERKYFHTVEVLTLILFYDLIHACGAQCPSIKEEIVRKGASEPLKKILD